MKIILGAVFLALSLSSYTDLPPEYRMTPTQGSGDEVVVITNVNTGEQKTATLCPGTGQDCTFRYTTGSGTETTYHDYKGKGKPDIEL